MHHFPIMRINLKAIREYDEGRRWGLIRKLGFSIQAVEDDFGANSKWRWSLWKLKGATQLL